ncbi:MAG: beta-Ala-His dipeptidase, partial [Streptococcaceae bacterium]|nr:beta-Ala-His dipeptidase [Streptococcaceae bacterium]
LNVIIKKPGQGKLVNAQPVILQVHIDMVGEKAKGSNHDFMKDPIQTRIVGEDVYATDTTLGADNGLGVAYSLALLDNTTMDLPPLECLFTTDEETGMTGAHNIDVSSLKGKIFINADCEEEGVLYLSCAGGNDTRVNIPVSFEEVTGLQVAIEVTGGKGGHSGLEINQDRSNSNKVMGRFLNVLDDNDITYNIIDINGGSKINAITRETMAHVVILEADLAKVEGLATKINEALKIEYTPQDEGVHVVVAKKEVGAFNAMTAKDSKRVVYALVLMPNGPQTYSKYIEDLVQTSINPGVLETKGDIVSIGLAPRSSVESQKTALLEQIEVVGKIIDAQVVHTSFYPAWPLNPDSKIKDLFVKQYTELFGVAPAVNAIHAGLECGLFKEKMADDVDFISFGPTILGAHTSEEHMNIGSADRNFQLLVSVLQNIEAY